MNFVESQPCNEELIPQMKEIAFKVIDKKFQKDFLSDIEKIKRNKEFLWLVYDYGTHFVPYEVKKIIEFQVEWLNSEFVDKYQLYVVRNGRIEDITYRANNLLAI